MGRDLSCMKGKILRRIVVSRQRKRADRTKDKDFVRSLVGCVCPMELEKESEEKEDA